MSEEATTTTTTTTQTEYHDAELVNTVTESTNDPDGRVIIIALDHSAHSQHAFDWAVKNFLRKNGDKVETNVVYVDTSYVEKGPSS